MNDQLKSTKVQLWQFLLEILTEKEYRPLIRWNGNDGEFEFLEPDKVAFLWGQRKGNATMDYSKMSRSLRGYYSIGIISKVSSQQYSYKFMFDLKQMLGYSPQELSNLMNQQ